MCLPFKTCIEKALQIRTSEVSVLASAYPKYDYFYWCRQCQKWIPKSKAKTWKNKRLACPYCNKQLRVKARHYKRKTNMIKIAI